ncbi:MAG: hypothetical protein M1816_005591 [Peltula sp. TS41687]|nr:MAG: hypothetical protein M1816_005591 [Peltula sp. TS41687]
MAKEAKDAQKELEQTQQVNVREMSTEVGTSIQNTASKEGEHPRTMRPEHHEPRQGQTGRAAPNNSQLQGTIQTTTTSPIVLRPDVTREQQGNNGKDGRWGEQGGEKRCGRRGQRNEEIVGRKTLEVESRPDVVGSAAKRIRAQDAEKSALHAAKEGSHEKGLLDAKDGTAGRQGEPREHDTKDEESDFGPDEAFPPGSNTITNKHPRLTDHQLVVMMKQAIADRTKGKLREICSACATMRNRSSE